MIKIFEKNIDQIDCFLKEIKKYGNYFLKMKNKLKKNK